MNKNRKNYLKKPELKWKAKKQRRQQQVQVPKVTIQLNGNLHHLHIPKEAKILLIITKSWKKLLIIKLKNKPLNSFKLEEIETMIVEEEEINNNNNKIRYKNKCF